jgi:dTDP-glucose 4,6-dehydratase/GDP-L-fucose synthase
METGGSGFRGSHLVEELERRSDDIELFLPRSAEDDRRDTYGHRAGLRGIECRRRRPPRSGGRRYRDRRENPRRHFDDAMMRIELEKQAR